MDLVGHLRVLRSRWLIVVLAVGVALGAGWATSTVAPIATAAPQSYIATTLLLGTVAPGTLGLSTVAALTTIEPVAERVADELGFRGPRADPVALAARVEASADTTAGTLSIRATAFRPEDAETLADTFAQELIGYLQDRNAESIQAQIQAVEEQLDQLDDEIAELDRQIAASSGTTEDLLTAERDAKIVTYGNLSQQYQTYLSQRQTPVGLEIVQAATAEETNVGGIQPPRSRTVRLAIAGLLGFLFGVGMALVLERLQPKIRTRESAERHYGAPVIAEIPRIRRRERDGLVAAARPRSASANAFRLLTAGISGEQRSVNTILVTSPGPSEGKTTVVANLAVAFADVGKSVLILSCDFTRPRVHSVFGVQNVPGLAEGLATMNGRPILSGCLQETALKDIRLVASGNRPENPGELLSSENMRSALREAREQADVVLIDTASLLADADAARLFSEVDAVLVVVREGHTTADSAERGSDILTRLHAPVAGLVLNEAVEASVPKHYFESDDSDQSHVGDSPH